MRDAAVDASVRIEFHIAGEFIADLESSSHHELAVQKQRYMVGVVRESASRYYSRVKCRVARAVGIQSDDIVTSLAVYLRKRSTQDDLAIGLDNEIGYRLLDIEIRK